MDSLIKFSDEKLKKIFHTIGYERIEIEHLETFFYACGVRININTANTNFIRLYELTLHLRTDLIDVSFCDDNILLTIYWN